MIVLPSSRHHASPRTPFAGAPGRRLLARLPRALARPLAAAAALPAPARWRLGITAILLYTLLAGDRGLVRLTRVLLGRAAIRADLAEIEARRTALETEIRSYHPRSTAVERVAREELEMVRPGEVVYKFPKP